MIPKIIHYCWFGKNPKSELILKCIDSWRKYCPDWEIIEWNEENYDILKNKFCREAYKSGKWAFVSDYARFDILNRMGGIYVDTDVEIIKTLDRFREHSLFAGHETDQWIAPGLILGAEPENKIIKDVLKKYDSTSFIDGNGNENHKTVGEFFTASLIENGIVPNGFFQEQQGIAIYPKDYFCPLDDATGVLTKTENTYTIHWYSKTWIDPKIRARTKITRIFHRYFGNDCFAWVKGLRK